MKCPNCGADYSADALACPYCGAENKVGIQRKIYKEGRRRFLAKKEKETEKKSLPEAIGHGFTWVMIFSIGLMAVSMFVSSWVVAGYEKRKEQLAIEKAPEHIAYLEQCMEDENYVPMESYLMDHELYDEQYYVYQQVSDCYQAVTYLRNYRKYLSELDPASDYFEEDLERYCQRIIEQCMTLVQYDDMPHYLYGELPERVVPILKEYQDEAMTTMTGTLGYARPEAEEVLRLAAYSEEFDTYLNMCIERVKKINGWQ